MKFDIDYIDKLAKVLNENGLTELVLENEEQSIILKKESKEIMSVAPTAPAVVQQCTITPPVQEVEEPKGKAIVSPMVGTFYTSPSPDAEPFVEVGSTVNEGDVVCIIEAMKSMNEIKAECSGKIVQVCVKNGEPVEFGQVLMYVE